MFSFLKRYSPHTITVLLILAALIGLYEMAGCTTAPPPAWTEQPAATPIAPVENTPLPAEAGQTDTFMVVYTDPYAANAQSRTGGPDEDLVAAVEGAQTSVDIAIYNLSLPNMQDALLRAAQRGVIVRLVMESESLDGRVPQYLMAHGIDIVGDRREGLMHNKFMVIDRREVWTGSMNYTATGAYQDHNHILRIVSEQLAHNYTLEFEEMFIADRFGPDGEANTPYPLVDVNGSMVEVYFSPDDGVARHIVDVISSARQSIIFMAYSFTSDPISEAVLESAGQGVSVRGVFEEEQTLSNEGTEWDRLKDAGLDVRRDGNPGQMHHKVFVIDGETVVLGSYNFSANAEKRNDENLLIIHNADLAQQFMQEFEGIYARGSDH